MAAPIEFRANMVKAILEGRKTQTRRVKLPRLYAGNTLWVKEPLHKNESGITCYTADSTPVLGVEWKWEHDKLPARFMPKSACRLHLQAVGALRRQCLDMMSEDEALSEGMPPERPLEAFRELWDSLNPDNPWESRPIVWVLEFRILSDKGVANG